MTRRDRRQRNDRVENVTRAAGARWRDIATVVADRQVLRLPEQEFRLEILNALLRTPHGDLEPFLEPFLFIHQRDPLFFSRLAAWYFKHGTVHDLKQLFIAILCTSKFTDEFRAAGLWMLSQLPPYQVARVMYLIKGHDDGTSFKPGLRMALPRSFRTAVKKYLKEREANRNAFESAVLHARESLLAMYSSLRIKPDAYAQRILFENDPPETSRLYGLKLLSWATDPEEQAMLIVENRIPYRAAVSAIKYLSPPVLIALVDVMSPQELINNLSSLKRRGALENEDVRALIECKLEQARSDSRVAALKTRKAMQSANLDEDLAKKVAEIGDVKIKAMGEIKRSTALFVDKSASMEEAIEVGKQIAAIIAPVCTDKLYVYAFDRIAYPIVSGGAELSDWERAFAGIVANGITSCGIALEAVMKSGQRVDQIIIVTDQGENCHPRLSSVCKRYAALHGEAPYIVIVNVGLHSTLLEDSLRKDGCVVDTWDFNGDYYGLPTLIPMLAEGTRTDLLMEIMSYPLPRRMMP